MKRLSKLPKQKYFKSFLEYAKERPEYKEALKGNKRSLDLLIGDAYGSGLIVGEGEIVFESGENEYR